jgi:hypothetical protein
MSEREYTARYSLLILLYVFVNVLPKDRQLRLCSIPFFVAQLKSFIDMIEYSLCGHTPCTTNGNCIAVHCFGLFFRIRDELVLQGHNIASHVYKILKLGGAVYLLGDVDVICVFYEAEVILAPEEPR